MRMCHTHDDNETDRVYSRPIILYCSTFHGNVQYYSNYLNTLHNIYCMYNE